MMVYFKEYGITLLCRHQGWIYFTMSTTVNPLMRGDTIALQRESAIRISTEVLQCFYLSLTDLISNAKQEGLRDYGVEREGYGGQQ